MAFEGEAFCANVQSTWFLEGRLQELDTKFNLQGSMLWKKSGVIHFTGPNSPGVEALMSFWTVR